MWTILEPLYYVSYATLVWGDLGLINFVDNTHLSQNQMAWLQWGRINGLDPQRGFEQKELELDIPPLQSEGVQFEATFLEPMMFESAYTAGPSSQPSFTKPPHTETSPHQTLHAPNHAP